ncbi:alpha/beta hydrolase-fold protein [Pirellulaceae bacterium SH449]
MTNRHPLIGSGPLFLAILFLALIGLVETASAAEPKFRVKFSESVTDQPIAGRLFVFTTTNPQRSPMQGPNWFGPEPFAALEVVDWKPGETIEFDDLAEAFPEVISKWPNKNYRLQAVLDRDFYYAPAHQGPGNLYSNVVAWNPKSDDSVTLELDQIIPDIEYKDTARVKFVERKSELLSAYFGKDVIDRAAVILPESYESSPDRRYPVYYEVTGFGGVLRGMGRDPNPRRAASEVEFIQVMLTGECKYGHHVYANSDTNGPRGDALVKELIPYVDSEFRTIADPKARFVGGHSSGGWSSLWLQVSYPETFGGVFSTAPDPVDFRDFQGTDMYAFPPQSVYVDPSGNRRPLARQGQNVMLWYDDFCKMDQVLGRGGQMRSFDAVFSPRDEKGEPRRAWDPKTGVVDNEVVSYWKKYDISMKIQDNWEQLKPLLAGKLHVAMGDLDTFYLEGATMKMAERLRELGSDAQVEIVPGAGHGLPQAVMRKMRETMKDKFLESYEPDGTPKK